MINDSSTGDITPEDIENLKRSLGNFKTPSPFYGCISKQDIEFVCCANFLSRIGFRLGDILVLVLGEDLLSQSLVPKETKDLVRELISERKRADKSIDPISRKLHFLQVELLDFLIKGQLNDLAEMIKEKKCV